MTLVRYRPFGRNLSVTDEVNQMLGTFFGSPVTGPSNGGTWSPASDVRETESEYIVRVDVPGVSKDSLKINVVNSTLTIKGEKKQETSESKGQWHHVERSWGSFERRFSLPVRVNSEKITATYADGVLEVTVPKSEDAKPREITIQS